jgi:RNA polymerase sigma-70 factor, ECF subfamily
MNDHKLDSSMWVDRYGDIMYRYTLLRVKDVDSAEEIVQNTFLAAVQAQSSFAGLSTEKSWLFGILKHKIMDHFRAQKRLLSFNVSDNDDSTENEYESSGHWKIFPKDWGLDPEKAAENNELARHLRRCLDALPKKTRQIFIMKEVDGLDSTQICNEFDIKPTNLWVILHRARNHLKQCLETHWLSNREDRKNKS